MSRPQIAVCRLPHGQHLPLPHYATDGAAGMDISAALSEPIVLAPGERSAIPTGLAVALPAGHEAQLRPRSGLALKYGLTLLNSPGTIDADYRGEIKVILANLGQEPVTLIDGMRIAQMVVAPVLHAEWLEVGALPPTERGEGGFGSTGVAGPSGMERRND